MNRSLYHTGGNNMEWTHILQATKDTLAVKLFSLGTSEITIGTFFSILLIALVTFLTSRLLQRSLARLMSRSGVKKEATIQIVRRLTHYLILLGGLVAALQTVGIDLSTLFAAGAVFAVGIGFAMQNIAQNFVSGVILLVEQSIKPRDILEVEGEVVKVIKMGIRSTVVRTRNEEELIVPNSILAQGMVKNFTLSDSSYLLKAEVGVTYDSDMKLVKKTLDNAARQVPWRDTSQNPRVLMREFGDSSVNFSVFVWITDPWTSRRLLSELNETIWWALKEAGITIAFPQVDVHFDREVEESLRLASSAVSGVRA